MKPLKDVLIDYNLTQLEGIAQKRGLTVPQNTNRETLALMVEELLAPASIAILMDSLSGEEEKALLDILAAGGKVETKTFARKYGAIRSMGQSKLAREKPWESPANPAESLWYWGVITKGFHHTQLGPEEVIFIPTDIKSALPLSSPKKAQFQISLSKLPIHIIESTLAAQEDLFVLLVYLQNNFVHLTAQDEIPAQHKQAIQSAFSFERQSAHWFEFILHLARRLDFLRKQGQRLKLHSAAVKTWLQLPPARQISELQKTWQGDPTWNDLWHIPQLHPKATGWENSPMLGRSKILYYLSRVPAEEWVTLDAFVQAIKETEADFQRPNGDYKSWYIYDGAGNALMGFEHWNSVEGMLIIHILTVILFALGVVDLGAISETASPNTFKITPRGYAFLHPSAKKQPSPVADALFRIHATDFTAKISPQVSLFHRFQLARFAHLLHREQRQVVYQIDKKSYAQAQEQSINLEQILAFLQRATGNQTPLRLVDALHRWDKRIDSVKLEDITVLRVNQAQTLTELRAHPEIGDLLGPPLGANIVLVSKENYAKLRELLIEHGFLGDM